MAEDSICVWADNASGNFKCIIKGVPRWHSCRDYFVYFLVILYRKHFWMTCQIYTWSLVMLLQLQSSLIQENFGIMAPIANSYSWDFTVSMEPLWLDCEFARKRDSRFPKKNTCYWKNITGWYLASWWDLSYLEGFCCFMINPFFSIHLLNLWFVFPVASALVAIALQPQEECTPS